MENDNAKFKVILILTFLVFDFVFVVKLVSAGHSNEFISYASNKIYNDCVNKNLIINKVYYDLETPVEPAYTIPWPYTLEHLTINVIKNSFDSQQWKELKADFKNKKYDMYLGPGYVGRQLLICGDHWLDISGNDWYWDGNLVEVPKLTLMGIKTSGDNSPVIVGNNNRVETNTNNNTNNVTIYFFATIKFVYNILKIVALILCLYILYIFFIHLNNLKLKFKFSRNKVKNSKNMYVARCKEVPNEVYIIENKNGRKFYNHIKDQPTRAQLGFSSKSISENIVESFSEEEYCRGNKRKTIEIINLRDKIGKDLEIFNKVIKLFKI